MLLVLLLGIPSFALFGRPGPIPTSHFRSDLAPKASAALPTKKLPVDVVEVRRGDAPGDPKILSARLEALERRLQQLGATYYRLEIVGSGQSYEFVCEIPARVGGQQIEVLTATGRDPLEPVERVIARIEQR